MSLMEEGPYLRSAIMSRGHPLVFEGVGGICSVVSVCFQTSSFVDQVRQEFARFRGVSSG